MLTKINDSSDARPARLSTSNRRLLARILRLAEHGELVATVFRAENPNLIDALDALESAGFLLRESDVYRISLVGLTELSSPEARALISDAKRIFTFLLHEYRQNQTAPVLLRSVAEGVGLSMQRVRQVLTYMVEAPWWSGRTTDLMLGNEDAVSVSPSEKMLKLRTFAAVLQQMRDWQEQRLVARSSLLGSVASDSFKVAPSPEIGPFPKTARVGKTPVLRERPDWIKRLPQPMGSYLAEIYAAESKGCVWLVAIGLRGVVESFAVKHIGDMRTYRDKLDALLGKNLINDIEHEMLAIVVDVGGASAHRMHTPARAHISTLFDIVERLLHARYVLAPAATRIGKATPKRVTKRGG